MNYSVSNNISTTGLSLVDGVTATLTLKPETNLRFIVEDSCLGDIVSQNFFENSQQTLTLIHGSGSFTNNFKGLNCGTINATVTLSVVNGQICCNVQEAKTFNKSLIKSKVEGNIVFDVSQMPCYLSISPSNAPIQVKRNGVILENNSALSQGDKVDIYLDEMKLGENERFSSITINGATYTSLPVSHNVNGNVSISVTTENHKWYQRFEGNTTISMNTSQTTISMPGIKAGLPTKFTTGQGTITYEVLDGCENPCGTGSYTILARNDEIGETGFITGSNTSSNGVEFGFTLTAVDNGLCFNAYANGYDGNYFYNYLGASIPVIKVEQYDV